MSTTSAESQHTSIQRSYVRYRPDVEVIEPDEAETIQKIIEAMAKGGQLTREKYGHSVRTSHAKAHALIRGELRVIDGLPAYLRQGLFAEPRKYDVIARLSHVPGDLDDDRKVSAPRGFSFKVFGVDGPMLPNHGGESTQDFVLDTGKIFNALGAKTFLAQISGVESIAPRLPESVKGFVSDVSRLTNQALNAVGANSSALDFFGHPLLHPLAEPYFSQVPIRYGDYIAKLSVTPDTPGLRALKDEKFDPQDYDAMRKAAVEFFRTRPAEFEVGIQLSTDLEKMPVENANKEWPEDESPYQPVARLLFPAQDAYNASSTALDDRLLFCPSHSMEAHRPLGSVMRARMAAYEVLGKARREQNGVSATEPRSIGELAGG